MVLLWYDFETEPRPFKQRLNSYPSGSVKRRVDDTQRFCLANNLRIQNQRLETLHIRFVDFFSKRRDLPLSIFWQRREHLTRDRVYFHNDPARVRFDHLRPIAEINFVAVIMRGVMTRRDNHARVRSEVANGEGKFRHRTWPLEDECVAAILGRNFGSELAKFTREKTRVMCDHDLRLYRNLLALIPILQICDESLGRTTDVKEIHCVRPDAWELRSLIRACTAAFRSGDDFPDRAPAKPARAKGKRLVKPVV